MCISRRAGDRDRRIQELIDQAATGRGPDECWPWPGQRGRGGYPRYGRNWRQHRIVNVLRWIAQTPDGLVTRHTCANPSCVNQAHLVTGTSGDNAADRDRDGHTARGEQHGQSKLTAADVTAIRASASSVSALARKYGVSRRQIARVKGGASWR